MPSFFSNLFSSVLKYKEQRTNDVLEAYPERLHVAALPERRYLKTSRVLVILALLSIALNFALGMIYMRMAESVNAMITTSNRSMTHLYQLDMFDKRIRSVDMATSYIPLTNLLYEQLIDEYINLRYTVVPNMEEMRYRWSQSGKVYLYGDLVYEAFAREIEPLLSALQRGQTQEVYIYSIKNVSGNLYEVIFDVFTMDRLNTNDAACKCLDKDKACLACLRKNAVDIRRFKVFMRVAFNAELTSRTARLTNPYLFNVISYISMPQDIRPGDPWLDVDLIKD